jgi:hypothetical protein
MPFEQTRRVMDNYFKALGTGDFARFLTDDVTCTTMETGAQVRGPLAVQDAVVGLHARMSDFETRQLVVSDDFACIEGSCLPNVGPPERISYCVIYDLRGEQIASMRAYGPLTAMMPILAAE